jgi:hypothetical protein
MNLQPVPQSELQAVEGGGPVQWGHVAAGASTGAVIGGAIGGGAGAGVGAAIGAVVATVCDLLSGDDDHGDHKD